MEKQLLKRLALSALVISSVAQARVQKDNKPGKLKHTQNVQGYIVPVVAVGLCMRNEISNAASSAMSTGSSAANTVASYTSAWAPSLLNTAADYTYRTERAQQAGNAMAQAGNIAADWTYKQATGLYNWSATTADSMYNGLSTQDWFINVKNAANKAAAKATETAAAVKAAAQATTETITTDLTSKHVVTAEEAAARAAGAWTLENAQKSASNAWINNIYYTQTMTKGAGYAVAAGLTAYAAYRLYNHVYSKPATTK